MAKKRILAVLLAIILSGLAAIALAGEIELRLGEGDEAMIYCEANALQVEMVDDLTVYVRCYDPGEPGPEGERRYYFPAVGDGNQVQDGS